MSAWKYKRIMPKVLVAKLRLIEPKDLLDSVGRDLQSIYSMLARTPYQAEISEIPATHLGAAALENAFLQNFIRTCQELMDNSPKDIRALLSAVLMKFEADNVKAILRTTEAGISVDDAMRYITPVGRLDAVRCRNILENSQSVNHVVALLSELEYGSALTEALRYYEEMGVLLPLEVALDKYVYDKIWRATGKLRGLDKKIARTVLGIEIDSKNIKVLLRRRVIEMRRYLIPVSEVFGAKEFEDAIKEPDIKSSIESLLAAAKLALARDHQYLLSTVIKEYDASESLSHLEMVLDRGLLKTSLRMLKRYTPFFNIGLILAFLNLKWFELRNLRAIVKGVEDNIPPAHIRKLLVLPS